MIQESVSNFTKKSARLKVVDIVFSKKGPRSTINLVIRAYKNINAFLS